jgi:NTE family protein
LHPTETLSLPRAPRTALVLPGGGARSAYQVGVLKAIASWYPPGAPLPFRVLCGTSAGSILAAGLAAYAARFRGGTAMLDRVWRSFRVDQVFRVDRPTMLRTGTHLLLALVSAGLLLAPPRSVFDNTPLRRLLERRISFARIRQSLDAGYLDAIAVTATSFGSGESVSFVQAGAGFRPWARAGRRGIAAELGLDHLMASAAVPFLFPSVSMNGDHYGDGAMRQLTPLSPALRLGAERILVVGVREPGRAPLGAGAASPPSLGQLFGFMLDTLFMEGLQSDLEALQRTNELLRRDPGRARGGLRHIEPLVLQPRDDLSAVALRHMGELPQSLRTLLRAMGASRATGGQLVSYMLFESGYTRALIELGRRDAEARRAEIAAFLGLAAVRSDQDQAAQAQ